MTKRSILEYKRRCGAVDTGPHEGPLWYDSEDNIRYSQEAFASGMEVIDSKGARRIARRAGITSRCNIFGDTSTPGVYCIQHRRFVEKGQETYGYSVTWDDRFFDIEDQKAAVAKYALTKLKEQKCKRFHTNMIHGLGRGMMLEIRC